MGDVVEVTDESFESQVLRADKPILVDFWAEWCGPCKMLSPIVEEVADELSDRIQIVKMDVDTNPETPQQFGIMGIPTLILFAQGDEVVRLVGLRSREALVEELELQLDHLT